MRSRLLGGLVAVSIACGLARAEGGGVPGRTADAPAQLPSACTTLSFGAPIPISTAQGPEPLVTADFNADGLPDLAVGASGTVAVRLGVGGGDFNAPSTYFVGQGPAALVVADFDGDAAPDLAVLTRGEPRLVNYVSLLLNAGGGAFTQAGPWSFPGVSPEMAAGDLDGDGLTDLAVSTVLSNTSGGVGILHGDGAGGFTPAPAFDVTGIPSGVATGDFNGDGRTDLAIAVTNGLTGAIQVRLGDGGGGFGSPTNVPTGHGPFALQAVDLNGDLRLDVVSLDFDDRTVSILYGDGLGGLAPEVTYALDGDPSGLAVADLDGDGQLDLAVTATPDPFTSLPSVDVLLADGAGSFAPPAPYRLFGRASAAVQVVAADFDGDGRLDLAASNGGVEFPAVSVLHNMCDRVVDLSLEATGTPSAIRPGRLAQYTLTVTNPGPDVADGVAVDATIPVGLGLRSITPTQGRCSWSSSLVECALGVLVPGGTATVTLAVGGDSLGTWTSNVTTSTGGADPNLADNAANVTTVVNLPGGDVLTLTSKADGLVHLGWNAGDAQAGYLIVRYAGGIQTILPGPDTPLPPAAVAYTDDTAVPGEVNCYVVSPVDDAGIPMARSSMVCMRPGSASATGAPVEFALTLEQDDLASLSWTGPPDQTASALVAHPLDGGDQRTWLSSGTSGYRLGLNLFGVATCFTVHPRNEAGWLGRSDLLCAVPGYHIAP